MNSKKMVIATLSLLLCALLVVGTVNFAIDPLFQYHKPWFGLKPVVTNERYQNAGIAKNFDFNNVIIGNSYSENFIISDVEDVFEGKTVKLTAAGSHVLDWTYILNILNKRETHPINILFNLDTGFIDFSDKQTKHELPVFLYDNKYFNDVEYLFNFTLTRKYTFSAIKSNIKNEIPDYNTAFVLFDEKESGKEYVINNYVAAKEREEINIQKTFYTDENLKLLSKYIESMPDTQFVFFFSPFSVLYWKDIVESGCLNEYKKEFKKIFSFMSQYNNVSVFFWTDNEMLKTISDLDNYKDTSHYKLQINKDILKRINNGIGILPKDEAKWIPLLDVFFDYIEKFDYTTLFT